MYHDREVVDSTDQEDAFARRVESLLVERTAAREGNNFVRADEIRDELSALGVEVMDTPEGPKWKRRSTID